MPFYRNPDENLRYLERQYAATGDPADLSTYNQALSRAGQEIFLPIKHLQMLFEDITVLLKYKTRYGEYPTTAEPGHNEQDNFLVVEGWHNLDDFSDVSFRVTAYNLYDPQEEHTNVHLVISHEGIGITGDNEGLELTLFPDDVIYLNWRGRKGLWQLPGEPRRLQLQLPLHQPWAYSARELLEFVSQKQLDLLIANTRTSV